jgi:hypothetical protein
MELPNERTSGTGQASIPQFYLHSPFRNPTFFIVTCLFVVDLVFCALALVFCLRESNLQAAFCVGFAVVLLVSLWRLGIWAHKEIQLLFKTAQITDLEKGSALDKLIVVTTRMTLSGLSGSFFLAGVCLAAFCATLSYH